MFSKGVHKNLQHSIFKLVNDSKTIDWPKILHSQDLSKEDKYALVIPFHVTTDKCPLIKLRETEWWDVFNDLIIVPNTDLKDVIILSSVGMHISSD
jgi:hypothetical protein